MQTIALYYFIKDNGHSSLYSALYTSCVYECLSSVLRTCSNVTQILPHKKKIKNVLQWPNWKHQIMKWLLIFHSIHWPPRITHIALGFINKGLFQCVSQKDSRAKKKEKIGGGYFQKTFVGGIKCNRCGFIVCVWILGPFWCVIPEIAKKIWNSNWFGEGERKERGVRGKEGERRGRGRVGRQETDDQARLLVHPHLPFRPPATKSWLLTALFAVLCSSPHLSSLSLISLPPLLWGPWLLSCRLAIGWLAVCHHSQHFRTILRTFYPNPVPPLEFPEEAGRWGRGSVGEAD